MSLAGHIARACFRILLILLNLDIVYHKYGGLVTCIHCIDRVLAAGLSLFALVAEA
jgi:hypothetical protein